MKDPRAVRIFRRVLRLTSAEFRTHEGAGFVRLFAELHRDAVARTGWRGGIAVLLAELPGLVRLAWITRRAAWQAARPLNHQQRKDSMFESLMRDLRSAVRALRRAPGIVAVTILTLALGVGANTAIFSFVHGILLKPLAFPAPERLVVLGEGRTDGPPGALSGTSPGSFFEWRESARSASGVAAYFPRAATLTGFGEPELLQGVVTVGGLLDVIGVRPLFGRTIEPADAEPDGEPVIVLSHATWQRLFGEDRDILGRTITFGGEPATVIGVMPPSFRFPDSSTEFWEAARFPPEFAANRDQYFLRVVARLRDGATIDQLRVEMAAAADRLQRDWAQYNTGLVINIASLSESIVGGVRGRLLLLMGAVGILLLITCANIANLLLARATSRRHEMAIRRALGAGWFRQVRQLLIESLLLSLAGAVAAIAVARLMMGLLIESQRASLPRIDDVALDPTVLAFTLAVAVAAGLVFGLAPAVHLARGSSSDLLREGGRGGERRAAGRRWLVVAELALALMLLVGAGLLLRSFSLLMRVETGLDTRGLITAQMRVPGSPPAFIAGAIERLAAIPGVHDVAVTSQIPLTGRGIGAWFNMYARPVPPGTTPPAESYRVVSPGFFETARIPLLRGRLLEETDGREGTLAVVVNEALAQRYFPESDAIGQDIYLGAPDNRLFDRATIVGVVGDTRDAGLGADALATVFIPHRLMPFWDDFAYIVRASGPTAAVLAAVRRELRAIAPGAPIRNLRTMHEIVHESVAPARTSFALLAAFAAIAVTLAALGVFGVLSYLVAQRTKELGVRLALGASPSKLRMLVMRQGLALTGAGLVVGLVGGVSLNRVIRGLLYGVTSTDFVTYAGVALLLLIVGGIASWIPARRATRVEPLAALRD